MTVTLEKRNKALDDAKQILITMGWTQGRNAVTEQGKYCHPSAPEAKCFCANGALMRALDYKPDSYPSETYLAAVRAFDVAVGAMSGSGIVMFNDLLAGSVDEVLVMFDKAKEQPL